MDETFVCHGCKEVRPRSEWAFSCADGEDGEWRHYGSCCYMGWLRYVAEYNERLRKSGDCCGEGCGNGIAFPMGYQEEEEAIEGVVEAAREDKEKKIVKLRLIHGGKA